MRISETVILKNNSNKVGQIINIEPMIQVRFNDGETCWHKEGELTDIRDTPVGTWLQVKHDPRYYGVVTSRDAKTNKYNMTWFIINGTQFIHYTSETYDQAYMNNCLIVPCPRLETSK